MPSEEGINNWINEQADQLAEVRVTPSMLGHEVRQQAVRRRRRRAALVAATAIVVVSATLVLSRPLAPQSRDTQPPTSADVRTAQAARARLQSYYSKLPHLLTTANPSVSTVDLMRTYLTIEAQAHAAAQKGTGDSEFGAVCGKVDKETTFGVGGMRRIGRSTLRFHVTTNAGPQPVDVDVDARSLRITNWVCSPVGG